MKAKRRERRTKAEIAADARRTGRPTHGGPRTVAVLVRVTPDERSRLDADAQVARLSVPDLLMRPWRKVGRRAGR
jgi:hypothetical protein